MSSEALHAPRDRLARSTITHHQAIASLVEELEAADWYRQRADDCEDPALRRSSCTTCARRWSMRA